MSGEFTFGNEPEQFQTIKPVREELQVHAKRLQDVPQTTSMQEIAETRTRNSATFRSLDGTTTIVSSDHSLFYRDGQSWKEIDTTLKIDRRDLRYTHSMTENNFEVRLDNRKSSQTVTFSVGDRSVTYQAVGMAAMDGVVSGNTITYPQAWPQTDMVYMVDNDELKMELRLADETAPNLFSFIMGLDNVSHRVNEDGSIDFYDESGQVQFQIPPMWVKDSRSDEPIYDRIVTQVESVGEVTVLSLSLDDTGLQYPLVLDPTTSIVFGAMGMNHTLAIHSNGTVWAWGSNVSGQLGDGTTTARLTPVQTTGLTSVVSVAGGQSHSIALKNDGTVWAWGYGQLVDGSMVNKLTPVVVSGLNGVVAIEAGGVHSLALKNDGTVWSWGLNTFGELGDGTTTNRGTPVQVPGLSDVVAISGGDYYSMALKSDGTVWAWGYNPMGQLGDGTTTNRLTPVQVSGLNSVSAISAGSYHSMALKSDGTVWTWGYNMLGMLGDGTTTGRLTPVQATGLASVTAISAGLSHSLALQSDGTVWGWGANSGGELGDGTTTMRLVPTQASTPILFDSLSAAGASSSAVSRNEEYYTWGSNGSGQLGNGSTHHLLVPTRVDLGAPPDTTPPSTVTLSIAGVAGEVLPVVNLAWTEATDDVQVAGYIVNTYHDGVWQNSTSLLTNTSIAMGVLAGTTYGFTVTTKDIWGNTSPESNMVSFILDTEPPTPPQNLTITGEFTSSVQLAWTASTDNEGVTGYDIYVNGQAITMRHAGTSYSVHNLSANTFYTFTVKARDARGNVSESSAAVTGIYDTQAPTTPTNVTITNMTGSSASLSWTESTDNVGVTGYDIYVNGQVVKTNHAGTSDTLSGLSANTVYTFAVKARDARGNVSGSSAAVTGIYDTQPPTAPTNVTITNLTGSSASLSWTASTDNVGVTGYDIYVNGQVVKMNHAGTSDTLSGLSANTVYTFTVQARDARGNVSESSAATMGIYDTQAPTAPTNVTITNLTGSSASLSWTASTDNVGVTGYDIYVNGQAVITHHAGTSYTINSLSASTFYTFTVKARDARGNVSESSAAATGIYDMQPPTAPTNVTIANLTGSSASLSWTASTDNVGVTGYDIYVNGQVVVTDHPLTDFTVSLANTNSFSIVIKARDAKGNLSERSVPVSVQQSIQVNYYYDSRGRLDYIVLPWGQTVDYQYDDNGNLLNIVYP